MFRCQFCNKAYKEKKSVIKHEPHCQKNPDYVAKIFACKYCYQEFTKPQSLGAHVPRCLKNPNYEPNLAKMKSSENKSHKHTEESRAKLSSARKKYFEEGGRILNGRGGEYNGVKFKSSWELIFAIYCDLVGIKYQYESQKASTHKTWVSDFEVEGELYEVGWHDHEESIKAFENDDWTCHLFRAEEIYLMRSFIPPCLIREHNLPRIDLKANRDKIKKHVETLDEARNIAEKCLGRTLKTKEVIWFKDNNPKNLDWDNIIIFEDTSDCMIFKTCFKNNRYKLLPTTNKHVFKCKKITPQRICKSCGNFFETENHKKNYCNDECRKKKLGFPWPEKEVLESLLNSMSMVKVAAFLRDQTGQKVSDNAVRKHCLKLGIELKPQGYWAKRENMEPLFKKEQMEKWIEEGKTCVDIAKDFNVDDGTVSDWFKFYGLETERMREVRERL